MLLRAKHVIAYVLFYLSNEISNLRLPQKVTAQDRSLCSRRQESNLIIDKKKKKTLTRTLEKGYIDSNEDVARFGLNSLSLQDNLTPLNV